MLFYLALVVADRLGRVDTVSLALAWVFVALRIVHSAIQVTCNRVLQRFFAYVAGAIALWLLWAYVAVGLFAR